MAALYLGLLAFCMFIAVSYLTHEHVEPEPDQIATHIAVIYPKETQQAYFWASIRPDGAHIPWPCDRMVAEFGQPFYGLTSVVKADDWAEEARGLGTKELGVALCVILLNLE